MIGALTLCLIVSSADNSFKQSGPRPGQTKCWAFHLAVSKQFDTLIVFLKAFFEKVDFEKKSADDKTHAKLPWRQRVTNTCPQGFSCISEVGAKGLLNLEKSIWTIKLAKLKNWTAIVNGLKPYKK